MDQKNSLDGLVDTGENPIRAIRNDLGLSLRQAAEKIGCNYQALYMNELGTYPRVLPVILDWLSTHSEYSEKTISLAYTIHNIASLQEAAEKYGTRESDISWLGKPEENPIVAFRERLGMSRSAFSKNFHIPISVMFSVENIKFSNYARNVPDIILTNLAVTLVPEVVLDEMEERYREWVKNVHK